MTINGIKKKHIAIASLFLLLILAASFSYTHVKAEKLYQQALHAHEEGKTAEAKAGYKQAIRLNPFHADANYQLGIIARDGGDVDLALKLMGRAVKLKSREPDFNLGLGFLYYNYLSDREKAAEYVNRAYELDPQNYYTCLMMAKLSEVSGDSKSAIGYYKDAIKASPNLGAAYKWLATLYEEIGMEKESSANWQTVLKLNPKDKDAISRLKITD